MPVSGFPAGSGSQASAEAGAGAGLTEAGQAAGDRGVHPGRTARVGASGSRSAGTHRAGRAGVVVLAVAVLFVCYWRQSLTQPVSSDGAANALQAWDMLHGNLLLHGWLLSDVSFYTTELPQYMLIEAI